MAVPMANDPPFATLNHFAADLGIPSESDLLRIGIRLQRRMRLARKAVIAEIRDKGRKVSSIAPSELQRMIEAYLQDHPEDTPILEFGCH
jgi:hypothetical protein